MDIHSGGSFSFHMRAVGASIVLLRGRRIIRAVAIVLQRHHSAGGIFLVTIKRAIISVSDKTGVVDFAKKLREYGVEIISTGGTYKLLKENGIEVKEVSDVTGFPEMLDGRVKTLHPKIHGGLLARRDVPDHMKAIADMGIEPIDMVVVNLYPFKNTVLKEGSTLEDIVENIDIGGPSMIRAAAKNYKSVAVVTEPSQYEGTQAFFLSRLRQEI